MILDSLLPFPEDIPAKEVIRRIRSVLAQSDEGFLLDPRLDLDNFIHRVCWYYGINPVFPLIALQREQGLLGKDGRAAGASAFDHATGVVGQHTPGTASTTWDGLPTQLYMAARTAAWLTGIGSKSNFGYRPGLWPLAERWMGEPIKVQLLNLDGSKNRIQVCPNAAEYLDWAYTPNALKNMPAENDRLYHQFIEPFFK